MTFLPSSLKDFEVILHKDVERCFYFSALSIRQGRMRAGYFGPANLKLPVSSLEWVAKWPSDLVHSELLSLSLEHDYWLCELVVFSCVIFSWPEMPCSSEVLPTKVNRQAYPLILPPSLSQKGTRKPGKEPYDGDFWGCLSLWKVVGSIPSQLCLPWFLFGVQFRPEGFWPEMIPMVSIFISKRWRLPFKEPIKKERMVTSCLISYIISQSIKKRVRCEYYLSLLNPRISDVLQQDWILVTSRLSHK